MWRGSRATSDRENRPHTDQDRSAAGSTSPLRQRSTPPSFTANSSSRRSRSRTGPDHRTAPHLHRYRSRRRRRIRRRDRRAPRPDRHRHARRERLPDRQTSPHERFRSPPRTSLTSHRRVLGCFVVDVGVEVLFTKAGRSRSSLSLWTIRGMPSTHEDSSWPS